MLICVWEGKKFGLEDDSQRARRVECPLMAPGHWGGEKASWIKIVTGHIIIGIATLTIGNTSRNFLTF
jgi:hypothetical protein